MRIRLAEAFRRMAERLDQTPELQWDTSENWIVVSDGELEWEHAEPVWLPEWTKDVIRPSSAQ